MRSSLRRCIVPHKEATCSSASETDELCAHRIHVLRCIRRRRNPASDSSEEMATRSQAVARHAVTCRRRFRLGVFTMPQPWQHANDSCTHDAPWRTSQHNLLQCSSRTSAAASCADASGCRDAWCS